MLAEHFDVLVVSSLNHGTQFRFQCEEGWVPNKKLNSRFKLKLKSILATLSSKPFCQSHNSACEAVGKLPISDCTSNSGCTCQNELSVNDSGKQKKGEKCNSKYISFYAMEKNSLPKIIKRRSVDNLLFDDMRYNVHGNCENENKNDEDGCRNERSCHNCFQRPKIEMLSYRSTLEIEDANLRIKNSLNEWLDNILNIRDESTS